MTADKIADLRDKFCDAFTGWLEIDQAAADGQPVPAQRSSSSSLTFRCAEGEGLRRISPSCRSY